LIPGRFVMRRAGAISVLFGTAALAACAVAVPTGPEVVVVPPVGKNLTQFQTEDASCRGYAQKLTAPAAPQDSTAQGTAGAAGGGVGTAAGASPQAASAGELQYRYDVAYAQCMVASGNQIRSFPPAWSYRPYGIAYGPEYYEPWYGSRFSLGFFGGFRHPHHSGFSHHESHHGSRRG
ncbi:MAG TPA: hypothetical protein VMB21_04455, partial [Candidatus Limnocylindria bacterium]|nr:hypothetical protein [Candidatus Limnocylindria bacterium]